MRTIAITKEYAVTGKTSLGVSHENNCRNPSNAESTYVQCTRTQRNPVMLVFIGKLSPSTLRVPICQGFSQFTASLHHFVLAKLAISSIRVNKGICRYRQDGIGWYGIITGSD